MSEVNNSDSCFIILLNKIASVIAVFMHAGIDVCIVTSVLFCFMLPSWETEGGNMLSLGIFVKHYFLKSDLKLEAKIQSFCCLIALLFHY